MTDLTGQQFGRWAVDGPAGEGHPANHWRCTCECGAARIVSGYHLVGGKTRSCGCGRAHACRASATTHGGCRTRLYSTYSAMLTRCGNPNSPAFADYGERGIAVCSAWAASFTAFRDWARAAGHRDDLTLERKDVNGPYSPENCCWIPLADQADNKRRTIRFTAFGETKTNRQWSRDPRCRVGMATLGTRIKSGWDPEAAVTTPARHQRRTDPATVAAIKRRYADGAGPLQVVAEFGVTESAARAIKAGRMWAGGPGFLEGPCLS